MSTPLTRERINKIIEEEKEKLYVNDILPRDKRSINEILGDS